MRYGVLGRLTIVRGDDAVTIGSYRQRSLLALLLINANRVVSTERIISELWSDDVDSGRQGALWVHMSNLRSALEPSRGRRGESSVILTRSPGYVLKAADEDVDSRQFQHLLAEGRALIERDPAAASLLIGEALALWRGAPYEEFAYESFAQGEIARLEEMRLEAIELRIDADLRRGLAKDLVGELDALARQHPLREHLTAQLMVALHRSGRRAEALRAYQRLRARLGEELGLEPSRELVLLEATILTGNDLGDHARPASGVGSRLGVRGYELREIIGTSDTGTVFRAYQPVVGREVSITVVPTDVANDPDFIRRFEAEAEIVANLDHPHVVAMYDFWREPDAAYLVTRLYRRGTLADATRAGSMSLAGAARVVSDVGAALDHAHRHRVVHGRVTSETIFVDAHERGYLGEFGLGADVEAQPIDDVGAIAAVLERVLDERPGDNSALRAALSAVVTRRFSDAASFAYAVHDALGDPRPAPVARPENPYKGLRAYCEADAAMFFGRERLVERLLARVGDRGTRGRFVAVVGASGSGKSSVVSAGLVPALRRGALTGADTWFVTHMVPGRNPRLALEAALHRVAADPAIDLLEVLDTGADGLSRAVRAVLPEGSSQLVLVVDQFEELFTQASTDDASAFLDALAAAVEDSHSRLRAVITVRADFYDRPLAHRAVGELLRRGTEVITPMSPGELERAITQPARLVGVGFELGLVAEMMADVGNRPGALPLMQHALSELFDERRGQLMERETYLAAGGVSGALARRADALYTELDPAGRAAARQIFLRLVITADEGDTVRHRVEQRQLRQAGGPAADTVLEAFGSHRLLTFDRHPTTREPTVEIAHEMLLVSWDRLRAWIDEARDELRQRRRLTRLSAEWERAERSPDYLVHGHALDQLAAWADATDLSLDPAERDLLDASIARRDAERSHDQARQRREEQLRRTANRRTRLLAVSALVVILLAAFTAFAVAQRTRSDRLASEEAATVEASRLAADSVDAAGVDHELAMLLALHSLASSAAAGAPALAEAEEALHWAVQSARIPYPAVDVPVEVRTNPDGPAGIYRMPLPELVDLARANLSRTFGADECARFGIVPCPGAGALASPLSSGAAIVPPAPPGAVNEAAPELPLAGTSISIVGSDIASVGLRAELDRFTRRTGVTVDYAFNSEAQNLLSSLAAGNPPDVALLAQPGLVLDLAGRGELVAVSSYIEGATARSAFGDYLVSSLSRGSQLYGIPIQLNAKGLVWYPVPEFAAAGYSPPATWAELLALSRRMVADGRSPWCIGFESDAFDGWPATDLVEAFVLRVGGVDTYDRWVRHEVPFTDVAVRQAVAMMGELVRSEGFVDGGVGTVNRRSVADAAYPMFDDVPGCWLHHQASFAGFFFPPGTELGVDVDFFALPPIERNGSAPLFGGGQFAVAFTDRPEVRELMRALLSPDWGAAWAATPGADFLPAHVRFDPERCRTTGPTIDARTGDLQVDLCLTVRDAVRQGAWRFDASDLMPSAIGALDELQRPGAFLAGMSDYTDDPDRLDAILAGIDAAWPA